MIYLQNYKVAVPVFEVQSRIGYQTIRKPTVFEKSILQLLDRYRDELGNQCIEQIANELKTNPLFFIDGLRYLVDFNAVSSMYGVSPDEGATLTLGDFDITADGKEFLVNNALPSSNRNAPDTHFYHPISRKLVVKKGLRDVVPNDIAVIGTDALAVTLATVDGIVEENIREKWKKKTNTRIESVESELSGLLWDSKATSIDIDNNGNLKIVSKDRVFQQWLDGAEKEFLWTQIIQHCFPDSAGAELTSLNWTQVKSVAAIGHAKRLSNIGTLKLIVVRDKTGNSKIPAIQISPVNTVSLQGNVLSLPKNLFAVNESLYALNIDSNLNATEVHSGNTPIHFAGQPRYVDLSVKLSCSELWDEIRQYLLNADDLDTVLFSSILGVEQAVKRLPVFRIKEARDYYQRMKGVVPHLSVKSFESKVQPLENIGELERYIEMFSSKNLASQKLLPTCFTELIIHSLSERKIITNLKITPVLSGFSKAYFSVQDMAGKRYFDTGDLACVNPNYRLLKLIDEWKLSLGKLVKAVPSQCMCQPELKQVEARMRQMEEYILSSFSPPREDDKRVIVIDTNCLMHKLHLLDQLKSSDWLVIPSVVLDELDGLKTDKKKGELTEKSRLARKAIDSLGSFTGDKHYEQDHLTLLKKNRNNSADAKVLSVAAYYRLGRVLLITEDKNLRNMANAENIPTQPVNYYLGKQGKGK